MAREQERQTLSGRLHPGISNGKWEIGKLRIAWLVLGKW